MKNCPPPSKEKKYLGNHSNDILQHIVALNSIGRRNKIYFLKIEEVNKRS